MSRRTFIKQWNPTVPIGGRGRGRGRGKRGSDPDQAFAGAFRTVHDPAAEARHGGGRDGPSTRFYSASGLTTAGLPANEDRFRAHTLGTRGGRGGRSVQQRVGMFRNAIQSNVIFGGPSDRVLRHSRRKLERIIAPESDVPESVGEWHRSPQRSNNNGRRRDVYEYATEEEEEEAEENDGEEERRPQPRRRPSNTRRVAEQRRDPDYDPFEFRISFQDEESEDEAYARRAPPARPRRPAQRAAAAAPSTSRAAIPYDRERLRDNTQNGVAPRRLFVTRDGDIREEVDYEEQERQREQREYRRRGEGRRGEEMGHEDERMPTQRQEQRAAKRPRDQSPARPAASQLQQPQRRPSKQRGREEVQLLQQPAAAVGRQSVFGESLQPAVVVEPPSNAIADAHYAPSIAHAISHRILSGLPPLRLKEDNGSQSYLGASRSIITSALQRFMMPQDENDNGDGRRPSSAATVRASPDPGKSVLRALMDRTQHIVLSEGEEDEDEEEGEEEDSRSERRGGGAFENIFSCHTSPDSPVLERLFEQTLMESHEIVEEADTADMLGLNDQPSEAGHSDATTVAMVDQFAITGAVSSMADSGSERSSISSYSNHSMASNRSMARATVPSAANFAAGASSDSSRSMDYSSDRSSLGSMGSGRTERSFNFQMSAAAAPPTNVPNYMNNNDGSFNFDF
ncbi:hypothetical protein PFISCL1PPCAC_16673 [Pristionchus fissidentatus]|uniref:Uncharacterized protein n=1 Tax=Pristionchus fissidentatus TaxID=1538716 RepID=A0AAV5W0M1_9BILA|nr:hypothetical protein PFISCL1PPCAC_16673 [Pristionchus fissidentatus]